jgi:hypothetical protein
MFKLTMKFESPISMIFVWQFIATPQHAKGASGFVVQFFGEKKVQNSQI